MRECLSPGSEALPVRMPPYQAEELEVQKLITVPMEAVIPCWAMELDCLLTPAGLATEVRNKIAGAHRHPR
jgi:hypothetical protein